MLPSKSCRDFRAMEGEGETGQRIIHQADLICWGLYIGEIVCNGIRNILNHLKYEGGLKEVKAQR